MAFFAQASQRSFIPIEQLAISPQCGFASGKSGGQMSIEQQERKLARIAEVAEDVWD